MHVHIMDVREHISFFLCKHFDAPVFTQTDLAISYTLIHTHMDRLLAVAHAAQD